MKYFLVTAACGHVGRGMYVPVVFPIKALNAEQAKEICRSRPRVKHGSKYAIISIVEVSKRGYYAQVNENWNDDYLTSRSKKEYLLTGKDYERALPLRGLKKESNVKRKWNERNSLSPRISKRTYINRYLPHVTKEEMRAEARLII